MRTTFSSEQIAALKRNPCIFSCTHNSINYTYEFKQRALTLHKNGVNAREIWKRSGFSVDWWKKEYFKGTLYDWKKVVEKHGIEGLLKPGGIQYDRGPNDTDRDKLKRLKLQVKYLEAENDFLAQLRAKRAELNSGRIKNIESSEN
ncbi:MAG: hypothetical protein Q8P93_04210 [bacterium]|nr:hypothetical protein [bacterium]